MKKVALLLLLTLCLCVPANAANFVSVTSYDGGLYYVDKDSIEQRRTYNDEYVVAWIKLVPLGDKAKKDAKEYKKPVDYELFLWALNKDAKQMQPISYVIYDKKGIIIKNDSRPFDVNNYTEIIPGSVGETVYNFVVNYNK